ncbi:MAG: hypothetical protein K0S44_2209 [Bacteroidetes bacterium]|jgi:hypothetical protein|nr:hypothetical protein [Bacteroidota bacterium]
MILVGCKPSGRFIEQHDIFFGISNTLKDLIPQINEFWPEAKGNLHIDAWREITHVDGYKVNVDLKESEIETEEDVKLFFLNLGGYRKDEFEEQHFKMIVSAKDSSEAIKQAKKTVFYKENGFKGAASHVDDKYTLDVDDIYPVEDILDPVFKTKYRISLLKTSEAETPDQINLGYLQLWKIKT